MLVKFLQVIFLWFKYHIFYKKISILFSLMARWSTNFYLYMSNLFIVLSNQCNGFLDIFIDIISLLSILFGINVINSKNPIVSVLFLIGLFISISLNLILLGYNFIGLSYLLVYVGAVSILFLFILMLINVRISELLNDTSNSIPLAIFTGFSFGFPVYYILNHKDSNKDNNQNIDLLNHKDFDGCYSLISLDKDLNLCHLNGLDKQLLEYRLDFAVSNYWDNNLIEFTDISSIGSILYSVYGIWLIISSIILLLAMVGAITITKK